MRVSSGFHPLLRGHADAAWRLPRELECPFASRGADGSRGAFAYDPAFLGTQLCCSIRFPAVRPLCPRAWPLSCHQRPRPSLEAARPPLWLAGRGARCFRNRNRVSPGRAARPHRQHDCHRLLREGTFGPSPPPAATPFLRFPLSSMPSRPVPRVPGVSTSASPRRPARLIPLAVSSVSAGPAGLGPRTRKMCSKGTCHSGWAGDRSAESCC